LKLVEGLELGKSVALLMSKIAFSHWLGPWLIQQLVLL